THGDATLNDTSGLVFIEVTATEQSDQRGELIGVLRVLLVHALFPQFREGCGHCAHTLCLRGLGMVRGRASSLPARGASVVASATTACRRVVVQPHGEADTFTRRVNFLHLDFDGLANAHDVAW